MNSKKVETKTIVFPMKVGSRIKPYIGLVIPVMVSGAIGALLGAALIVALLNWLEG